MEFPERFRKKDQGSIDRFDRNQLISRLLQSTALPVDCGRVAQLVEQWIENPCVGGSSPPLTTCFSLAGMAPMRASLIRHLPDFA